MILHRESTFRLQLGRENRKLGQEMGKVHICFLLIMDAELSLA
jgi:hypothetical protein